MIEQDTSRAGLRPPPASVDFSDTFESRPIGAYLRQQRILRGMSCEELAEITRIPVRSLDRLENGQFDGATDGFVRGFVRTVAVALGLDADDTISRMLKEADPASGDRHGMSRRWKQGLALLVAALILAVGYLVLRAGWGLLVGNGATPASRDVVVWRDPVRGLAEATGVRLDPADEIEPRSTASRSAAGAIARRSGAPVDPEAADPSKR
jgi:hypothetical protein